MLGYGNDYTFAITYRLREQELIKQAEESRLAQRTQEETARRQRRAVRVNNG